MLLQLAIGDAYGAGFEYVDIDVVNARNDLSAYVRHPRHAIRPGRYTDDTQMSIAIAEAIISGEPWTPLMLAARFVTAFKRDPRQGYAGRFYDFLRRVRDGTQFLAEIQPTSDKSGAAMRAAPIGVYPTVDEVIGHEQRVEPRGFRTARLGAPLVTGGGAPYGNAESKRSCAHR